MPRVNINEREFSRAVLTVVARISSGQTMTYRAVAAAAGSPRASRAVGNILNKNYDPRIPCHRVIRSDGALGGYNRGARKKARLLALENKQACR